MIRRSVVSLLLILAVSAAVSTAWGQRRESLSDKEIEDLREAAYTPASRIGVFQKIIDSRISRIQDLLGQKYAAGRIEDLHDLMQQVADIAIELEENLEDYRKDHRDVRKPLPKLIESTQKWSSVLRQPEKNEAYELTRSLALDSLTDVKDEATEMEPELKAWFKDHPPSKEENHPVEMPR